MAVSIEIGDWLQAPAHAPQPAFAIGDVHGRDDLFGPLLEALEGVAFEDGLQNAVIVTLGDYIDRGPTSISALNRALDGSSLVRVVPLPGNHEQFLRGFLESDGYRRDNIREIWFNNGGDDVARELDFDPKQIYLHIDTFDRAIRRRIGEERLERFFAMRNHVRLGQYLFVHAGIHPDIGLAMLNRDWRQRPSKWAEEDEDPLWIRGPFLTYEGEHEGGVIVVHGHTPRPGVELRSNRINIDTRAYELGRLSAVQLHGSRLRFIQAVGPRRESAWATR
jgi:serine/threonine protein phosphatase 1